MAEYETILTDIEDGIGRITVNRPDSRNSLNTQVLGDIRSALAEFRYEDRARVIVFTGVGEKAFAAGADIRELKERTMFDALASLMQAVYDEVEAYEKPTIAAVNGLALGGGCELALACDSGSPRRTRGSGSRRSRSPSSPARAVPSASHASSARAGLRR